ncbi:MAG TPA: MarR family transcriptional regulator [Sphingobium sp.]|nr:MarR family transcriptional regulator [Sphingobium sp.]
MRLIDQAEQCVAQPRVEPVHLRLIGVSLNGLLRRVRESNVPGYEREGSYKEIQRQLIIMIGMFDGLSSQEIVTLTGHEKAQVSRAIKPLEEAGLIERPRLRAKLTLCAKGRTLYNRLLSMSRARDAMLTAGIPAESLKRFAAMTDELTIMAAHLYTEERRRSAKVGFINPSASSLDLPSWPQGRRVKVPTTHLVTPKLISLAAYLNRSAMLVYQRCEGLSHFQWQVLSRICDGSPMPLARLILDVGRDKSQVGRTVSHLETVDLILRSRPTLRRDIVLEPTSRGMDVFRSMYDVGLEREAMLMSGFTGDEQAAYLACLDRLTDNAQQMLEQGAAPM